VKLLLDTCVWGGAADELRSHGHDVVWSGDWHTDPGDEEILAIARAEGRVLVTLDKDFGELAIVMGQPHSGILRVASFAARQQGRVIQQVLCSHGIELAAGAVITAMPGRLRIRPPESDPKPEDDG
jgi:predicted nuclease of predicted toxin-antitoxin system